MDRLNQWLTLVANVGVVLGIVFLAYELRQNTEMMRAQTKSAAVEQQMLLSEWLFSDDMPEVFLSGRRCELPFGSTDYWRFLFLATGVFREWENSVYQAQLGLYDEAEFAPRRARWERAMANPGFRYIWSISRQTYSPQLRAELEGIGAAPGAEECAWVEGQGSQVEAMAAGS